MVCMALPIISGGLNGFFYSGYTIYFRKMGWDLSTPGIAYACGMLGRIGVQQLLLLGTELENLRDICQG